MTGNSFYHPDFPRVDNPNRNQIVQAEVGKVIPMPRHKLLPCGGCIPRNMDWAVNTHGNVIFLNRWGELEDTGVMIGRRAVQY